MNVEFLQALRDIEREKDIPLAVLNEIVEAALVSAYKKHYGGSAEIHVDVNWDELRANIYIRKLVVEYPQGNLATRLEATGNKRAAWRTDPKRSGAANCMADIGTHAENLAEYVTGLKITELCADLTTFVGGRLLDDDGSVLLRLENGARGILHASKISAGEDNGLRIRVYGEQAGLEWEQQQPNILMYKGMSRPTEIHRAGTCYVSDPARFNARLPAGHPEGFIEAFANIYRNFILSLQARLEGRDPEPEHTDFPTVRDGVRGMAFIATVVESSQSDRKWTKMNEY